MNVRHVTEFKALFRCV